MPNRTVVDVVYRELHLKRRFGDMSERELAVYSLENPKDLDFADYMSNIDQTQRSLNILNSIKYIKAKEPNYKKMEYIVPVTEITNEKREQYLKKRFTSMSPNVLAKYANSHPENVDVLEYMTCYATPRQIEHVPRLIDKFQSQTNSNGNGNGRVKRKPRSKNEEQVSRPHFNIMTERGIAEYSLCHPCDPDLYEFLIQRPIQLSVRVIETMDALR